MREWGETNPALGLRSIRLCLQEDELFRTQLRAILRVSGIAKNVRIMFPMISGLGELHAAKDILNQVKQITHPGVHRDRSGLAGWHHDRGALGSGGCRSARQRG